MQWILALLARVQRSLWDPYRHFPRPSRVVLQDERIGRAETCDITVDLSDKEPDYTTCRRPVAVRPPADERPMRPMGDLHIISSGQLNAELTAYRGDLPPGSSLSLM